MTQRLIQRHGKKKNMAEGWRGLTTQYVPPKGMAAELHRKSARSSGSKWDLELL